MTPHLHRHIILICSKVVASNVMERSLMLMLTALPRLWLYQCNTDKCLFIYVFISLKVEQEDWA